MASNTTYEGITTVLVPKAAVSVPVTESAISGTTIGTDYLGPCICFLFDFTYRDQQVCVLSHYTFSKNDKGASRDQVLVLLMEHFVETIRHHINLTPSEKLSSSTISDITLLVVGGDPDQSRLVRHVLSLLNSNFLKLEAILRDPEQLYVAQQLINKIILFNTVTRVLARSEQREAKELHFDMPCVWINYCCITKNSTMGITWSFGGENCELAILQLNLFSKGSCVGWHIQENAIKLLREKYSGKVLSTFNDAISLIPKDPFFTHTLSSSPTLCAAVIEDPSSLSIEDDEDDSEESDEDDDGHPPHKKIETHERSSKEKDDKKTKEEDEMRAVKSDILPNLSETITEDKVRNLLLQKQRMTFGELIQYFLPTGEDLQTKEIKDFIAQKLATILKDLHIEEKIINEEQVIQLKTT